MQRLMKVLTPLLLIPAFASSGRAAETGYFASPRFPVEVQAAHDAYFAGHYAEMVGHIRDALMKYPQDVAVKKNLLGLLNRSYEVAGKDGVGPDYQLPKEATWMALAEKKSYSADDGGVRYRLVASVDYRSGEQPEQFRLVRYPDQVVMDYSRNIGSFDIEESGGEPNLWGSSERQREPFPDGLYLFEMKFRNGKAMKGYALYTRMHANDTPEVSLPSPGQVIDSRRPTFAWKDFVSSEYRSYERRRIRIAIARADSPAKDVFIRKGGAGGLPLFTSAAPDRDLAPGKYDFRVSYRESRRFGPIQLRRESDTYVPFEIR